MSFRRSGWMVAGLGVLFCLASASQVLAANATYTATGGPITGTLDGIQFDADSWSITATADTAGITVPAENAYALHLPTPAVLTTSGLNAGSYLLPNLDVFAGDEAGVNFAFFQDMVYGGRFFVMAPGTGMNLTTATTINSVSTVGYTGSIFTTSQGQLSVRDRRISPSEPNSGTFSVSYNSVPEATTLILGGLGVVPLVLSRKRRRALSA